MNPRFQHWHWMPLSVFVVGALSLALLLWSNRLHERQLADFATVNALAEAQGRTATFHLWLEEILAGDSDDVDSAVMWHDLEIADTLLAAILSGGTTAHGTRLAPLRDPKMRSRAAAVRSLLVEFKTLSLERLRRPAASGIGSQVDKLSDDIFLDILRKIGDLENAAEAAAVQEKTRTGRYVMAALLAWALLVVTASAGLLSRELRRRAAQRELRTANERLRLQAEELESHRGRLAELVEQRTGELSAANKRLRAEINEQVRTQEALRESQAQLRRLSAMLFSAQEEERKKISRELHDELGQSLTLVKFQLRSVSKRLREDQGPLKNDCDELLRVMNTVIDNVRRLSRDLCPYVLDDLGLKRALQWLADTISVSRNLRIDLDLADVDRLFPREAQTSLYRIVQEAFTNIVKHSGAGSARVELRKEQGRVSVAISDDGRGFDVAITAARAATERGLGLASMAERVRLLGGELAVRSVRGKGTSLSFSIPVKVEQEVHEQLPHHTSR